MRALLAFILMAGLLAAVWHIQSPTVALGMLNLCLISAVMALGVAGYFATRHFYGPAVDSIEAVDPGKTGYLGGLGLPILFSWIVGGAFAAGAAWLVGKIALGLRADYLAIATLGISEIIVAVLNWLTRGVKNVTGLPRPVPYEIDLQRSLWFREKVEAFAADKLAGLNSEAREGVLQSLVVEYSGLFVKLCFRLIDHPDTLCVGAELSVGPNDPRDPRQRNCR